MRYQIRPLRSYRLGDRVLIPIASKIPKLYFGISSISVYRKRGASVAIIVSALFNTEERGRKNSWSMISASSKCSRILDEPSLPSHFSFAAPPSARGQWSQADSVSGRPVGQPSSLPGTVHRVLLHAVTQTLQEITIQNLGRSCKWMLLTSQYLRVCVCVCVGWGCIYSVQKEKYYPSVNCGGDFRIT